MYSKVNNFNQDSVQVIHWYEMGNEEPGTTLEEVLAACNNRLRHLNGILASRYNEEAIIHISKAIQSLNERTQDRLHRNVEGTQLP